MTFDEYATIVDETCVVPADVLQVYAALGLVGECGEVADVAMQHSIQQDICAGASTVLNVAAYVGELAELYKKKIRGDDNPEFRDSAYRSFLGVKHALKDVDPTVDSMYFGPSEEDVDGEDASKVRDSLRKELGDVLWYLAAMCKAHGLTLDDVAQCNMDKLRARKVKGSIRGSGDDR